MPVDEENAVPVPLTGSELARAVGRAIAGRRHDLGPGHSQEWLGEQVGLSKQTISRMENGVIAPTIFRLQDISAALGCTMGELLDQTVLSGSDYSKAIIRLVDSLPEAQRESVVRVLREVVLSLKH